MYNITWYCVWPVGPSGGEAAGKGAGLAHQTQAVQEAEGCMYHTGIEQTSNVCLTVCLTSYIYLSLFSLISNLLLVH